MIPNNMNDILEELIGSVDGASRIDSMVRGRHWIVSRLGKRYGVSSTLDFCRQPLESEPPSCEEYVGGPAIHALRLLKSEHTPERPTGMAVLNAALPSPAGVVTEENAFDILERISPGRSVAVVGHFPGMERLKKAAGECHILELHPTAGDLPSERSPEILARSEVIGLSSTTLLNGTFGSLMKHIRPGSFVALIGPSTPLSPVLFHCGVSLLCGAQIIDGEEVKEASSRGASFREMRRHVQLVNYWNPEAEF